MSSEFEKVYSRYTAMKTEREKRRSLWNNISKFVGIGVDTQYLDNNNSDKSKQLDEFVDDPTATICVNQFGDYLVGIMWGTGDGAFKLVPSRYVLEKAEPSELEDYFSFTTGQALYHMNHSEAGLNNCLKQYAYDQAAFGTSGIGGFPNKAFIKGAADNALIHRPYGVDNTCIDEGKAGAVEYVFATYHWRVSRIVNEFCMDENDKPDDKKVAKLPDEIKQAWDAGQINSEFTIVFGFYPRADYNPKVTKGKKGTRYKGIWMMDKSDKNAIFAEEDFAERPVAMARMIKVRGDIYGRAAGTMLLSTIRAVNFMLATAIEILEKMANPSLGMFNNAIFGDAVLDTSPNGLTIFNSAMAAGTQSPTFPLFDVGNPEGILKLLIPYLNEKVTSAFKVDALLDFNSNHDMTATESLHRYAIRGKSLSGILTQQKAEMLEPLVRRDISILWSMGQLGVNPREQAELAKKLKILKKQERVVPDAVLDTMAEGRPWYELQWFNELEKMTRSEKVEALVKILQAVSGIAALFPPIVEAIDWYKMLKDINDNLDSNNQIVISATDFKKKIKEQAALKQQAMAMQAGLGGSEIMKNTAQANKHNSEANGVAPA